MIDCASIDILVGILRFRLRVGRGGPHVVRGGPHVVRGGPHVVRSGPDHELINLSLASMFCYQIHGFCHVEWYFLFFFKHECINIM